MNPTHASLSLSEAARQASRDETSPERHRGTGSRLGLAAAKSQLAVRIVLAVLFLVAAGMKAWALWLKPFSSEFLLGSRTLEMAVVYAEVLMAFWLLLGWAWPLAWLTTVSIFLGFTAHNAWQVWEGHASCGCFGQLRR